MKENFKFELNNVNVVAPDGTDVKIEKFEVAVNIEMSSENYSQLITLIKPLIISLVPLLKS